MELPARRPVWAWSDGKGLAMSESVQRWVIGSCVALGWALALFMQIQQILR
jgi:hypothetical protein